MPSALKGTHRRDETLSELTRISSVTDYVTTLAEIGRTIEKHGERAGLRFVRDAGGHITGAVEVYAAPPEEHIR